MSSTSVEAALATPSTPRPLLDLFLIWLHIGATSFGGGSATQLLIQQHFVVKRNWMTPEAFAQDWAIVQFAPGINLIALTVLIGHRFGRWPGIAVSLLGMLGPAVAITIAMTALYARVRELPQVQGALRGLTPALVGLSLAFMWRLLKGPMQGLNQLGPPALAAGLFLLVVTAALTAFGMPVLASYLVGAAGLGVVYAKQSDSLKESDC
jgi:chromate transporter